MEIMRCTQCGSNELIREGEYMVCKYCSTRYVIEKSDIGIKESSIALGSDIEALLQKCKNDPRNARKYANLILDLDPDNDEALK